MYIISIYLSIYLSICLSTYIVSKIEKGRTIKPLEISTLTTVLVVNDNLSV